LLADAHANAADPVRLLCYFTLPFELAYNWTPILHRMVGALGVLLLLRRLGIEPKISLVLALTWGWAGFNAIFWGHPWVAAAFAWYPWLWLAWETWAERPSRLSRVGAVMLCGAIFYAGNLQSHSYLPLFGLIWIAANAGRSRKEWLARVQIVAVSGLLGACLAAPVLWPEVELFLHNERSISAGSAGWHWWDAPLALAALFPWSLGTFRTVGYNSHGFLIWIGSAGAMLAVLGLFAPLENQLQRRARRVAVWLVVVYFLIVGSPLNLVFYTRSAGLPTLGLLILAAFGAERLRTEFASARRWVALIGSLTILIAVGSHLAAWVLFPRMFTKIEQALAKRAANDATAGKSATMRAQQLRSFASETTFQNPECLWAWAGLAALALVLAQPRWRLSAGIGPALLALNFVPLLLFTKRYVPDVPIENWHRLRNGSPEQQELAAALRAKHLRLLENTPSSMSKLFPMNTAHFHGIHVVQGYSALQPHSMMWHPVADERRVADRVYEAMNPDQPGRLRVSNPADNARFFWADDPIRGVRVEKVGLHQIILSLESGKAGTLVRTDTHYPGWTAVASGGTLLPSEKTNGLWTAIFIPAQTERILLSYRPTGIKAACGLAIAALLGCVVVARTKPKRSL
jgi:hypothetical protein